MSFFNYPIYDVPDMESIEHLKLTKPINIIVRDSQYNESDATLLSKILGSVKQSLDVAELSKVDIDRDIRLTTDGTTDILIIIFGLTPNECSLQLDKRLYTLFKIKNKTLLFSRSLQDLPSDADGRRALWMALKKYYNLS